MESSSEESDINSELCYELKNKHFEHFQNLVKMHLSFALDSNIDENDGEIDKNKVCSTKWGFSKKMKLCKDVPVETNSLTDRLISRLHNLIAYLSLEENIRQEGIFRKTGALTRQAQLKTCINEGIPINYNEQIFSVHDCASVLKSFLSELSEPLVTDMQYIFYCQISEWCKLEEFEGRLLRSLQLLFLLLPSNNALLLKYVMNLLHLTIQHVNSNKMSAENLATLFTPHILCPRKLKGEALHSSIQSFYHILVFMIKAGPELFKIPEGLAADVRLYWHQKEVKRRSPKNCLNESTADNCVVNTVISFVDRARTSKENVDNPTETALAQLYAHIQSLPESSKKRKLVKQFNKENGYGTPKRTILNNNEKPSLTRNIGDSLKKHIFSKGAGRHVGALHSKSLKTVASNDNNGTPEFRCRTRLFERRLDCLECGQSDGSDNGLKDASDSQADGSAPIMLTSCVTPTLASCTTPVAARAAPTISTVCATPIMSAYFYGSLTSTPALQMTIETPLPFCGPNDDMSPISMSAQKMPKCMQEAMMTPRSRQPVLTVSNNTNSADERPAMQNSPDPLTGTFRRYLYERMCPEDDGVLSDFDPASLSDDRLSDSLLYCLNTGTPPKVTSDENDDSAEYERRVHETSL